MSKRTSATQEKGCNRALRFRSRNDNIRPRDGPVPLGWKLNSRSKFGGGIQNKVGLAKEFTTKVDDLRIATLQDGLG